MTRFGGTETEVVEFEVPSLIPRSSVIALASGHGRDVLQHGLTPVTEAGALTAAAVECPAKLVDH